MVCPSTCIYLYNKRFVQQTAVSVIKLFPDFLISKGLKL